MNTITVPPILSAVKMARHIRVPVPWLLAEAEAGRVPCLRAGDVYLFSPTAVVASLAERAASRPVLILPEVPHVSD